MWESREGWERPRGKMGGFLGMGGESPGLAWQSQRPWRGTGLGYFLDFCLPSLAVNCSITWAVFVAGDYNLLMLVEVVGPTSSKYFQVVSYDLGNWGTTGGC